MIDTNALMGDQSKGGSLLDFAVSMSPIGQVYSGMRNLSAMFSDDPDVRRGTMVGTFMGVDPSVGDKGILGGFGGDSGYYGGNASGGLGGGGLFGGFGGFFGGTPDPTDMALAELNFEGGDTQSGGGSTSTSTDSGGWSAGSYGGGSDGGYSDAQAEADMGW